MKSLSIKSIQSFGVSPIVVVVESVVGASALNNLMEALWRAVQGFHRDAPLRAITARKSISTPHFT